jgi:hypothetical protein
MRVTAARCHDNAGDIRVQAKLGMYRTAMEAEEEHGANARFIVCDEGGG